MGRKNTGEPEKIGGVMWVITTLEKVQVKGQKITTNPETEVN